MAFYFLFIYFSEVQSTLHNSIVTCRDGCLCIVHGYLMTSTFWLYVYDGKGVVWGRGCSSEFFLYCFFLPPEGSTETQNINSLAEIATFWQSGKHLDNWLIRWKKSQGKSKERINKHEDPSYSIFDEYTAVRKSYRIIEDISGDFCFDFHLARMPRFAFKHLACSNIRTTSNVEVSSGDLPI